ncbi:MAG: twin-arginine translocase TatA/TatE family subunit [Candidatus Coatesbacteria bacterium]|nr:twin-arginine translocase TatA/TatE family subunit [Candidatus Coatesbacteria bacterium]
MWSPGPTELIVILVIVLIIFGAGKLPGIGKALGKGIKEFKDGTTGKDDRAEEEAKEKEAEKTE